jgi:hypothetical protein
MRSSPYLQITVSDSWQYWQDFEHPSYLGPAFVFLQECWYHLLLKKNTFHAVEQYRL